MSRGRAHQRVRATCYPGALWSGCSRRWRIVFSCAVVSICEFCTSILSVSIGERSPRVCVGQDVSNSIAPKSFAWSEAIGKRQDDKQIREKHEDRAEMKFLLKCLIIFNPPSENADWSHGVKGTWRTTATSPQVVAGSQVFLSLSPFSSFSYWSLKGLTWGGSIRTSSWSRWRTKMTKRTKWMQQWQNMLGSLIESNLTDFGEKRTKTYCKKGIKGSGTGSTPGSWGQRDPKKSRSRSWTRKSSSKGICFFPWVSMAQYKPLPFYGL